MPGPGRYLPDATEGITRPEDLPKAKVIKGRVKAFPGRRKAEPAGAPVRRRRHRLGPGRLRSLGLAVAVCTRRSERWHRRVVRYARRLSSRAGRTIGNGRRG